MKLTILGKRTHFQPHNITKPRHLTHHVWQLMFRYPSLYNEWLSRVLTGKQWGGSCWRDSTVYPSEKCKTCHNLCYTTLILTRSKLVTNIFSCIIFTIRMYSYSIYSVERGRGGGGGREFEKKQRTGWVRGRRGERGEGRPLLVHFCGRWLPQNSDWLIGH